MANNRWSQFKNSIARRIGVNPPKADVIYHEPPGLAATPRSTPRDLARTADCPGEWQDWLSRIPGHETTLAAGESFDNRRQYFCPMPLAPCSTSARRRIFGGLALAEEQITLVKLARNSGRPRASACAERGERLREGADAVKHHTSLRWTTSAFCRCG